MATTVTYKGATLTTVTNDTATLETAGTWLEDDITITDSSGSGTITVIDVPDAHGGIEKRITAVDISDTTAQAADVAQGKVFYTAYGTRTVGTASGGGGWTTDGIATNSEPNGVISLGSSVTLLDAYALAGAPITRCIAPYVSNIKQYAFINAFTSTGRIEDTDFPHLTYVTGAFEQCNFEYVNMPAVTGAIAYAFRNCPNLVEIHLPNTASAIDRTCLGCRKLEIADLGKGNISNGASFQNCTALRTLVLRNTAQVQTINAWSANCMGGIYNNPTESTIYVPQALISQYQQASNWSSAYAAGVTFAAIEGSQYEL